MKLSGRGRPQVPAPIEKADRVIESESTLVLTRRESVRLLELIENPPPRNELFLKAQARYRAGGKPSDEGALR